MYKKDFVPVNYEKQHTSRIDDSIRT